MASASKPAPSDDGMSIKTGASKRSMRSYAESVRAAKEKAASEKPEDFEFFEGADAGSGEQFMAVRPYEGAIEEPDEHPEENDSPPDVEYQLEHVYGYRCEDSR